MSDMTIQQFCDKHKASKNGREWALANCVSMQNAWNTIKPEWLIWIATRPGVLTDRELRLFSVWSARQVQHLMEDPRSVQAIDTAERFANGNATKEELDAAWDAAWVAAQDATWDAACATARAAACAAVKNATWDTAWDAARACAQDATLDTACATACADAWDAAQVAQADWLGKNTTPNFEEAKP